MGGSGVTVLCKEGPMVNWVTRPLVSAVPVVALLLLANSRETESLAVFSASKNVVLGSLNTVTSSRRLSTPLYTKSSAISMTMSKSRGGPPVSALDRSRRPSKTRVTLLLRLLAKVVLKLFGAAVVWARRISTSIPVVLNAFPEFSSGRNAIWVMTPGDSSEALYTCW